jgi:hypothetical protein
VNICPKCGSDKISPPKYQAGGCATSYIGGAKGTEWKERLIYTCLVCGYVATTPTWDAQVLESMKDRQ